MTEVKVRSKLHIWWLAVGVILVAGIVAVIINRQWIVDYWRGMSYEATSEMGEIRDSLSLTDKGEFLFKATWPKLSGQDEFNVKCRTDGDEEIAVLGCYTEGNIYIYEIESAELEGILELTTAHELLHAVWARMGEDERRELTQPLMQTFEANQDLLEKELTTYDVSERQEELFVRAGTEVKNLPSKLEKVYEEVFANQDKIVDFYESYIGVFREIEAEMDELTTEMGEIQTEIETKTTEYKQRAGQLNADVVSFNACAEVAGCFKSEDEFYARRAGLMAEQGSLYGLYEEINRLVDEYNARVDKYNADVTRTEKLNRAINSNSKPEGV